MGYSRGDASLKSSLKYLFTVGLIVLQVAAVAAILITSRASNETLVLDQASQLLAQKADSVIEATEEFLIPAEVLAVSTSHFAGEVIDFSDRELAEHYFYDLLKLHPQVAGMFIGEPNGGFAYVSRSDTRTDSGFRTKLIEIDALGRKTELIWRDAAFTELDRELDPDDTYDPTSRPWFTKAATADGAVWTDPYVFFTSRSPGITTAAKTSSGSVVGVDIEIAELSKFIGSLDIGDSGSAFIMDRSGGLIAYPDPGRLSVRESDGSLRLARVAEINDPVVRSAFAQYAAIGEGAADGVGVTFSVNGVDQHATFAELSDRWPWTIAVHAPVHEFTGSLAEVERRNLLLAILVGAISTVLAIPIVFGLTRPMRRLRNEATTDQLTGLPNRRYLVEKGIELVSGAVKSGNGLVVIMADLDHFKTVNDSYGHAVGDAVLKAIAQRMASSLRDRDFIGRWGGEEFCVYLPSTELRRGIEVAERLRHAIRNDPVHTEAGPLQVRCSFGVADLDEWTELDDVVAVADLALLEAKAAGRDRVFSFVADLEPV